MSVMRDRLEDVMEAILRIEREMPSTREEFMANDLIQVWMLHHLQAIGEALRRVSHELNISDPSTPWSQIVGMRHILVHDYLGIDLDEVWETLVQDVPKIKRSVLGALNEER